MKRVLCLTLVFVLLIALAGCNIPEKAIESNGLKYTLLPDDTYAVSAGNDFSECSDVVIPADFEGKAVTVIADRAFQMCNNLTSITIPNSIVSIGEFAFSDCTGLTDIAIPDSVVSIGGHAFAYCENLVSVNIGNGIKNIPEESFTNCIKLENVIIPNGVISIGYSAFASCENFTSITIPSSVTSIQNTAFANCNNLTNMYIPSSVSSIGYSAFNNIPELHIYFEGTKAQWNDAFNSYLPGSSVAHCADGDIT